jgi:regulator of protease activity HflC (stomatin/prohibitin superfamily)
MADDVTPVEPQPEGDALGAAPSEPAGKERRLRFRRAEPGQRRMPIRIPLRRGVLLVVVPIMIVALTPMVGGAFKKTPRDKIGISYGGGLFEGAHYQRTVQPGSGLFFNGWFDSLYLYPADQRNYIITKVAGQGSTKGKDSIVAPSRDRVQVEYQVAIYFRLNTDRLRQFHEQLGLKYHAYTSSGWDRLIQDTFRQQVENALQSETRRYDVAEIFSNSDLLRTIQSEAQQSLSERLRGALGHTYFCGPTFTSGGECSDPTFVIKKVDIPARVIKAFESNRTSQVEVLTKQNEIQQRAAEAEAITVLNEALSAAGENYVLLRAIESGKVNFWVIPGEATIPLPTSGPFGPQSSSPPSP